MNVEAVDAVKQQLAQLEDRYLKLGGIKQKLIAETNNSKTGNTLREVCMGDLDANKRGQKDLEEQMKQLADSLIMNSDPKIIVKLDKKNKIRVRVK
jgi:hypothetical protein